MDDFFEWLAEGSPLGEFHLRPLNRKMELKFTAQRFQVMAREEAEPRSKDEKDDIRRAVYSLVKSYLSSPGEGYVLQFITEHKKHLWYPLGTSSSWSQPVGLIEVLVDFPRGLWLEDPEPEPDAIYRTGTGIKFFWRVEDGNPSSDIEGDIVNRTMPMGIYLKNSLAVFLNTGYKPMAALVNILVICLIWYSAILFSWSFFGPSLRQISYPGIKRSLTLGFISYFLSVFSVLAVLPVLYFRDDGEITATVSPDTFPGWQFPWHYLSPLW